MSNFLIRATVVTILVLFIIILAAVAAALVNKVFGIDIKSYLSRL